MYKEIRGLCTIHGSLAVLLQKQGNLPECSVTYKHFIILTMKNIMRKKNVFDVGRGVVRYG
jgi:hypothetical protein